MQDATMISIILIILCLQQSALTTKPYNYHSNELLTFSIPDNRAAKIALGYIEDTYLNFTELTTKYGYPTEEHEVVTEDGYMLTVFRIKSKCKTTKGYPVLLVHGINDSSDGWIVAGPKIGFGYILSGNCYDVWAANLRGNVYSRKHITLDPNRDYEFWNYTMDENGNFDLPAIIDYVLLATQKQKVYYMGHSQGTTDFFIMASLRPEYNDKVHLSILLAPIAWFKYLKNPLAKIVAANTDVIKMIADHIGLQEVLGKNQLVHHITEKLCQVEPVLVCGTILEILTGLKPSSITPRTLSVIFGHLLVGTSIKTLAHFGQLIQTMKFERYNEGKELNLLRYGTEEPPAYNVTKITSPVLMMCSKNDLLSSLEDVNELTSRLPNVVEEYVVQESSWSHNNYLWGTEAPKYVFGKILSYLKIYDNK